MHNPQEEPTVCKMRTPNKSSLAKTNWKNMEKCGNGIPLKFDIFHGNMHFESPETIKL